MADMMLREQGECIIIIMHMNIIKQISLSTIIIMTLYAHARV